MQYYGGNGRLSWCNSAVMGTVSRAILNEYNDMQHTRSTCKHIQQHTVDVQLCDEEMG